jgi:hypothetical protein
VTKMPKTKGPTAIQTQAIIKAVRRAYWDGWNGADRSVDASHHAPCIESGRNRYRSMSSRVRVPTPTANAMERLGLVTDYNGSGWLWALTPDAVKIAEAAFKQEGKDPLKEAAAKRDKEAEAAKKQKEEFRYVLSLFEKFSIIPTGKKTSKSVASLIKERAESGGNCCFDLNELEQIGLFLSE